MDLLANPLAFPKHGTFGVTKSCGLAEQRQFEVALLCGNAVVVVTLLFCWRFGNTIGLTIAC